jgi:hypothetical protein
MSPLFDHICKQEERLCKLEAALTVDSKLFSNRLAVLESKITEHAEIMDGNVKKIELSIETLKTANDTLKYWLISTLLLIFTTLTGVLYFQASKIDKMENNIMEMLKGKTTISQMATPSQADVQTK